MQIDADQAEAVVNFIQTETNRTNKYEQVPAKIGCQNIVFHPGHTTYLKFPVLDSFHSSFALFEIGRDDPHLEQLDMGDCLAILHHTERPYVEIPVTNPAQHDIILTSQTTLGSIEPNGRIVETDQVFT